MARQKAHLRAFVAAALGGPQLYAGRDMHSAHAGLGDRRRGVRPRGAAPRRRARRPRRADGDDRRDRRHAGAAAPPDRHGLTAGARSLGSAPSWPSVCWRAVDHRDVTRREFARQVAEFERPDSFFGDREVLDWIAAHVPVGPERRRARRGRRGGPRRPAPRGARGVRRRRGPDARDAPGGRRGGARPGAPQRRVRRGRRDGAAVRRRAVRRRASAASRSITSTTPARAAAEMARVARRAASSR